MANVVLVRHGQASFGADDYDKLSPLGHQQAAWLGEYFLSHDMRFDRVVRGGLRRHRETANGICGAMGIHQIDEDTRFDEFHYDPLQTEYIRATGVDAPTSRDAFLEIFPDIFTRWELGQLKGSGETYAAFRARVDAALDAALSEGTPTLIVTSGGVIGAVMRRVLDLSARKAADLTLNIHNASVHSLNVENGALRLSVFNASPHLDPKGREHARTYV